MNQFWVNLGVGGINGKNILGAGYSVSLSYYSKSGLFSLKFNEFEESVSKPTTVDYSLNRLKEINFSYGIIFKHKIAYLSGSTGLSYFWRQDRNYSLTKEYNSIGIPIEIQAFFYSSTGFWFWINTHS